MGFSFERQKNYNKKFLDKCNRKLNKVWLDKGSKFFNISVTWLLQENKIEMYSTYNEGKSVVAERFTRTWKNKIYKYMTSVLKNMYIVKLNDIVDEYSYTYHRAIRMKLIDVKLSMHTDFSIENNDKDPKFEVGDCLRISKYWDTSQVLTNLIFSDVPVD